MRLEVDELIEKESYSDKISEHERNMLMFNPPNVWNINRKDNMEVQMEKDFEKFMLAVSEHTNENIDDIKVFRFYVLIEFIKEKNAKNKRNGNN